MKAIMTIDEVIADMNKFSQENLLDAVTFLERFNNFVTTEEVLQNVGQEKWSETTDNLWKKTKDQTEVQRITFFAEKSLPFFKALSRLSHSGLKSVRRGPLWILEMLSALHSSPYIQAHNNLVKHYKSLLDTP